MTAGDGDLAIPEGIEGSPESVAGLERAKLLLEGRLERLEGFIRGLAHDLKTPLTPLLGASELLASGVVEKPWSDLAKSIQMSAENLHRMVDDLLDLEQCERGSLVLECSSVDAAALAGGVAQDFREAVSAGRLELAVEMPGSLPPVWADAIRLRQVIATLLGIAIRNTPGGGRVVLRAAVADEMLHISVIDNGTGIGEDDRRHVFEPYRPLVRGKALPGGIGLALAGQLAALHGGELSVENGADKGNIFWLRLPVTGSTPNGARAPK